MHVAFHFLNNMIIYVAIITVKNRRFLEAYSGDSSHLEDQISSPRTFIIN